MGAPVTAYNRIYNEEIRVHSNIYEPEFVAVVDETLLKSVNVTEGLSPEGGILVNTHRKPEEIEGELKGYKGKVCTIDAQKISEEILGVYFPNMPMLAAMIKMTGFMEEKAFMDNMLGSLKHKFATKPQVVAGNMEVLKRSLGEVLGL